MANNPYPKPMKLYAPNNGQNAVGKAGGNLPNQPVKKAQVGGSPNVSPQQRSSLLSPNMTKKDFGDLENRLLNYQTNLNLAMLGAMFPGNIKDKKSFENALTNGFDINPKVLNEKIENVAGYVAGIDDSAISKMNNIDRLRLVTNYFGSEFVDSYRRMSTHKTVPGTIFMNFVNSGSDYATRSFQNVANSLVGSIGFDIANKSALNKSDTLADLNNAANKYFGGKVSSNDYMRYGAPAAFGRSYFKEIGRRSQEAMEKYQ